MYDYKNKRKWLIIFFVAITEYKNKLLNNLQKVLFDYSKNYGNNNTVYDIEYIHLSI